MGSRRMNHSLQGGLQRKQKGLGMVKVSVITAVYNVEAYLEKCLDSLLAQTLPELEIIAVNDGSTDGSQQILERYMEKTDKLKCFYKENGGAAAARNYGLQFATGAYVGYVDSDDFVDAEMFQVLYEKAVSNDSDIVECNLRHTYATGEDIEVMERFYKRGELLCFGRYVVWNKLYRRDWLMESKAGFPAGYIYEDVAFVANLTPYIRRYDYVDIAPVHYVQRRSSINNSTSEKTMHILPVLRYIVEFYKENGFYETFETELEYLHARILLCSSLSRMCHMRQPELRKRALRENWSALVSAYPQWRKNPILRTQKTHQAIFMKTVNAVTYRIYGVILPVVYRIKAGVGRKWQ